MKRPVVPCRECDRRTVTCHGSCEEYRQFRAEQDAYAEETRTVRSNYLRFPTKVHAIERAYKRMRRNK